MNIFQLKSLKYHYVAARTVCPNIYVRAQENSQNVNLKDNYTTPECSISY